MAGPHASQIAFRLISGITSRLLGFRAQVRAAIPHAAVHHQNAELGPFGGGSLALGFQPVQQAFAQIGPAFMLHSLRP